MRAGVELVLVYVCSLSKVLAVVYCDIDKESDHILGREWVLLLGSLKFTRRFYI
jgi:hypothetical protein